MAEGVEDGVCSWEWTRSRACFARFEHSICCLFTHGPARLPRDLRLPDERGRQRAHARPSRRVGATRRRAIPREADVILLNTCAIREHAEERVFGRLGAARCSYKLREPRLQIGLAGCMAQHHRDARCSTVCRSRFRRRPRRLPAPAGESRAAGRRSDRRRAARPRRDLRRPRAGARRRRARVDHDHARLRQVLHLLRRAVRARPRAQPAADAVLAQVRDAARAGLPRGRLPRPDGQRVPRRRPRLRRPAARRRRASTASSASASPRRTRAT